MAASRDWLPPGGCSHRGAPPIFFSVLPEKKTGRTRKGYAASVRRQSRQRLRDCTVQKKRAQGALRCSGPPRGRGSPETVLTKTAGFLPARAGPLIFPGPVPRVRCGGRRGGKLHGLCFCPRCRSMVPRRTRQRLAERKARKEKLVKCVLVPRCPPHPRRGNPLSNLHHTPPRPWGGHRKLEGTLSRPAPV